jgi:hypothetical protein
VTKDYHSVQYTGEDYDYDDDDVHFVLFNCRHDDSRLMVLRGSLAMMIMMMMPITLLLLILFSSLTVNNNIVVHAEKPNRKYKPLKECGLYLAPSSIPGAGLGMYSGSKPYIVDELVSDSDLMIPTWDFDYHNGLDDYSFL